MGTFFSTPRNHCTHHSPLLGFPFFLYRSHIPSFREFLVSPPFAASGHLLLTTMLARLIYLLLLNWEESLHCLFIVSSHCKLSLQTETVFVILSVAHWFRQTSHKRIPCDSMLSPPPVPRFLTSFFSSSSMRRMMMARRKLNIKITGKSTHLTPEYIFYFHALDFANLNWEGYNYY